MHPGMNERSIWAEREQPAEPPRQRRTPEDAARRHYVAHAAQRVGGMAAEGVPGENGRVQARVRTERW